LRSIAESTGEHDREKWGRYDFRGRSSEKVFLRQMGERFRDLFGPGQVPGMIPRDPLMLTFDIPRFVAESPSDRGLLNTTDLPSQEVAQALCSEALNCACCLLCFIHVFTR
jgi:hypothetical protein